MQRALVDGQGVDAHARLCRISTGTPRHPVEAGILLIWWKVARLTHRSPRDVWMRSPFAARPRTTTTTRPSPLPAPPRSHSCIIVVEFFREYTVILDDCIDSCEQRPHTAAKLSTAPFDGISSSKTDYIAYPIDKRSPFVPRPRTAVARTKDAYTYAHHIVTASKSACRARMLMKRKILFMLITDC